MLKPSGRSFLAKELPKGTVGIRLVRMVGEELRQYEAIRWPSGRVGITQFLRQQVLPPSTYDNSHYGLIDLLDEDQNILDDIGISTAEAFQRIRRKLKCKVVQDDPEAGSTRG